MLLELSPKLFFVFAKKIIFLDIFLFFHEKNFFVLGFVSLSFFFKDSTKFFSSKTVFAELSTKFFPSKTVFAKKFFHEKIAFFIYAKKFFLDKK